MRPTRLQRTDCLSDQYWSSRCDEDGEANANAIAEADFRVEQWASCEAQWLQVHFFWLESCMLWTKWRAAVILID
jgi:hypothetical protein